MRPITWKKVIDTESETCYWLDDNGIKHQGTEQENSDIRDDLLMSRIIFDQKRFSI